MQDSKKDIFLSHASVDKERYVRPFTEILDKYCISYWLDEAEIKQGDKIGKRINDGLNSSYFVVVFISENFVARNWTETELSASLGKENKEGKTIVLPIIIGNPDDVLKSYPLLQDKAFLKWDIGLERIVRELNP